MQTTSSKTRSGKTLLILSTGGTLGMKPGESDGSLRPDQVLSDLFTWVPELENYADIQVEILANLDSSQIEPPLWLALANRIIEAGKKGECHGVVILHGTDTLAFSASALSFLLLNLKFPVVLTGAQRPLAMTRTDARNNILGAVESALEGPCEVMVFFHNTAFRGNRISKIAIGDFDGFDSPNYPPLGWAGMDWHWTPDLFLEKTVRPDVLYGLPKTLPEPPVVIPWVPGLRFEKFESLLEQTWGIVLEAFGAGNMPLSDQTKQILDSYIQGGGLVIARSQVLKGKLSLGKYAPGKALSKLGVALGQNMTRESTITKAMFLKALNLEPETMVELISTDLAGELS